MKSLLFAAALTLVSATAFAQSMVDSAGNLIPGSYKIDNDQYGNGDIVEFTGGSHYRYIEKSEGNDDQVTKGSATVRLASSPFDYEITLAAGKTVLWDNYKKQFVNAKLVHPAWTRKILAAEALRFGACGNRNLLDFRKTI